MAHGSGGSATRDLIEQVFQKAFRNPILDQMNDAAVFHASDGRIAFTTDSYVVTPLFFKGGDIGKLAVCGTVNDLLMMGAQPKYLTAGFILEEGLDLLDLQVVVQSMQRAAAEANVQIIAGDTKVIEGHGGLYINTSGIGFLHYVSSISGANAQPGDIILMSGSLGNHHACILSHRMGIHNQISSDCAPLHHMVYGMLDAGLDVKVMRDVTRGGLATILNEIAESSSVHINIKENELPIELEVKAFCGILGLDPLYMGNEGKMVCVLGQSDANQALSIIRSSPYGEQARIIGSVEEGTSGVTLTTRLGGKRILDILHGEGLPRIC